MYNDDDKPIPYRHHMPYTPDGIPLEIVFGGKEKAYMRRKPQRPSVFDDILREQATKRKAIKDATREHIKDGGMVTAPDTLVERIYEALFGEE